MRAGPLFRRTPEIRYPLTIPEVYVQYDRYNCEPLLTVLPRKC